MFKRINEKNGVNSSLLANNEAVFHFRQELFIHFSKLSFKMLSVSYLQNVSITLKKKYLLSLYFLLNFKKDVFIRHLISFSRSINLNYITNHIKLFH